MIAGGPPSFLQGALLEVLLRDPRSWSVGDVEAVEKRIISPALRAVSLPAWISYADARIRAMEILLGDSRNAGRDGNPPRPVEESLLDKVKLIPEVQRDLPVAEIATAAWLRKSVTRALHDWLDYEGLRHRGHDPLPEECPEDSSRAISTSRVHLASLQPEETDAEGASSIALRVKEKLATLPARQRLLIPLLIQRALAGIPRTNSAIGEIHGIAQQRVAEAEHALIAIVKAEFLAHDVSHIIAFSVLEHLRLLHPVNVT